MDQDERGGSHRASTTASRADQSMGQANAQEGREWHVEQEEEEDMDDLLEAVAKALNAVERDAATS
jgi:hypothetical protein